MERPEYIRDIESKVLDEPIRNPGSSSQPQNTPSYAIWGNPGQGKTQTALRFTYQFRGVIPLILWVSADRENKLLGGMSDFAHALCIVDEKSKDLVTNVRALVGWFQTTDEQWLLVFDNAETKKLLSQNWPLRSKRGAILITTRDRAFSTAFVAGYGSELPPLPEASAVEMLKQNVPSHLFDDDEARKAVTNLGCLPLGIQAIAGLMNDAGVHMTAFIEQWGSPHEILSDTTDEHTYRNFAPYEKALADVWFEELRQETDSDASQLVETVSLLDLDTIQEELFVFGSSQSQLKNTGFIRNRPRCLRTLKRLMLPSTGVEGSKYQTYHVHRLLQAYTQLKMTAETRQRASNYATVLVSNMILSRGEKGVNWPRRSREYKDYFPHVQTIHQFYKTVLEKDGATLQIPVDFLTLLRKAEELSYKRSFFQPGLELLITGEGILADPNAAIIGDERDVRFEAVEMHYTHGCIATELPDFDMSLKHFERAKRYYDVITVSGFVLNGYEGGAYLRKALALKPPSKAWSAYEVNLSRCMIALEKLDDAKARLEDFLRRRAAVFGVDDTEEFLAGHALYWLGNILIQQNQSDEAFRVHLRALQCFEHTYGRSHHKFGTANYKVAWHYYRSGQTNAADLKKASYVSPVDHLNLALEVYRSGTDQFYRRADIARTLYKLSQALAALGREAEARKHLAEARELREQLSEGVATNNELGENWDAAYDDLVSRWSR
ncbi:hypothetical protein B0H67DRAFT_687900 [Lasiosphaeris hirsuta]|uniref:DUF7779 domain-containing protein n=1 Tax=Lasiosphaeris hirsuta TaxID=260670 RepID=A0AA39ZSK9_9PEZI|nr:hypothetical protein B0H67DRAFT_687900 [Lasiosphaeris hirsuta]